MAFMASASGQVSVEALKGRSFSFYPAIRNIEHNEWTLDEENWSELHVANRKSGYQIWIPRNYVGSISSSDSPVLIVGLNRELEFKGGAVWPYRRTVIEMPRPRQRATGEEDEPPSAPGPAVLRLAAAESKVGRLLAGSVLIGLLACLFLVLFASGGNPFSFGNLLRPSAQTADQRYLGLSVSDNYHDVILKLGKPEAEQWISSEGAEIQFQLLRYPTRSYAVVMMGASRSGPRYIGTLHEPSRRILDSAKLSNGGSTTSMLKNLPEY
jgi:hypothetical protein